MLVNKKDSVLKKIREALTQPTPIPFPKSEGQSSVFHPLDQEIEVEFAEQFTSLQGQFAFCLDEKDLLKQLHQLFAKKNWRKIYCVDNKLNELLALDIDSTSTLFNDLASCDAAITRCEYLIARTGSIVMSAAEQSSRVTSVYTPIHICIAYTSQLVYDIKEALESIKLKYIDNLPSLITFATGPSRTADIEKTLVVGVHGPKEVYVFLIDDKL